MWHKMWGVSNKCRNISSYDEAKRVCESIKPLRDRPNFRPLDMRSSRVVTDIRKVGEDYIIKMYNTEIVTYRPDGRIFLDRGGWPTVATASAMSASSPFACWVQKGEIIVRSASLKRFVLPRAGLLFVEGEPVDPPAAVQHKTRVKRELARQARSFFKAVPKLMASFAALCAGQPRPADVKKLRVNRIWDLEGVLDEADAGALAWYYLGMVCLRSSGNGYTVNPAQKSAIAHFWKEAYDALDVIEEYDIELPFGEVAK